MNLNNNINNKFGFFKSALTDSSLFNVFRKRLKISKEYVLSKLPNFPASSKLMDTVKRVFFYKENSLDISDSNTKDLPEESPLEKILSLRPGLRDWIKSDQATKILLKRQETTGKKRKYEFRYKYNILRRAWETYSFVDTRNYLLLNFIVKPNNMFVVADNMYWSENISKTNLPKFPLVGSRIHSLNANNFKIKFSKKGIKGKVLTYVKTFLRNLKFLKVNSYGFAVIRLTSPKFLRKIILTSISKFFLAKKFLNKKVIIDVRHMKIFNGCVARKERRKKRKKFTLYR